MLREVARTKQTVGETRFKAVGRPYGVDEWNRRRLVHTLLKTKTSVLGEARTLIMGGP